MRAVIGGSGVAGLEYFKNAQEKTIATEYGKVALLVKTQTCFLQRHGTGVPPHNIDHRANILALKTLGADRIYAISSTGSLKKEIRPASIVVIEDYMQLSGIPTFFSEMNFTTPGISKELRQEIIAAAQRACIKVRDSGIYAQTRGPRYETKAEVRMLSHFADLVGMTLASEATLVNEAGIPYAAMCTVDNYANGIGAISMELMKKNQASSLNLIEKLLGELL